MRSQTQDNCGLQDQRLAFECIYIVISLCAKDIDERSYIFGSWVC